MNTALALVMGVALLRAWLCARQLRSWADTSGTPPVGAAERVRWRLLLGLLQGLVSGAVLIWLQTAAPRGAGAGLIVLVALACLPSLVDSLLQPLQGVLRNRSLATADLAGLLRSTGLQAGAALVLAPLALGLCSLTPDWWWLGFVAVIAPAADPVANRYRYLAGHCRDEGVPAGMPLAVRLNACLNRWGHGEVHLLFRHSTPPQFNARAERSGSCGSIVLFEALVKKLQPEQIEAVMAHELGHLAGAHLQRRRLLLALVWLVVLGLGSALAGGTGMEPWRQLGVVLVMAPSLRFLLQPLVTRCLQRWELQADAYAAGLVAPDRLACTLSRLFELNGAAATSSDPWFALFHESHPPLPARLAQLHSH